MIRIQKPAPPSVLTTQGSRLRRALCSAYTKASADYRSGAKTFEFHKAVYGNADVKRALVSAQHNKCAFCEAKVTHIAYGDVEHFRPKAGWVQDEDDPLSRPGYYWLAYDWDNLVFACQLCNQRFKKNLFPLEQPGGRVLDHHGAGKIEGEQPLFIHPAQEDPEDFIVFEGADPRPRQGNTRGHKTLVALGLARTDLMEQRQRLLKLATGMLRLLQQGRRHPEELEARQHAAEASQLLAELSADPGEYAAMLRCLLRERVSADLRFPLRPDLLYHVIVEGGALVPTAEGDGA